MEGGGEHCWPRPGRILAAARTHTFAQLAEAIDDAFARWDRAHLCQFDMADGARVALPDPDWDEPGETLDYRRLRLTRPEDPMTSPTRPWWPRPGASWPTGGWRAGP